MTHEETIALQIAPGQVIRVSFAITIEALSFDKNKQRPSLQDIATVVSEESGLGFEQIASKSRKFTTLVIRYAFCHVAHDVYGYSLKQVGEHINRDHTTVINSCAEFKSLRDQNRGEVLVIISKLQKRFGAVL